MFRSHLDPLLERAHTRWQAKHTAYSPAAAQIDQLFTAIQREFEELRNPFYAEQFQALAVALLIGAEDCAIANVGTDRAWVLRDGRLERISDDYSLGSMAGPRGPGALPENLRDLPGSYFGRFGGMAARWQVRRVDVREGDVLLLASEFRNIEVSESQLELELKRVISGSEDDVPGQRAVWRRSDRAAQRLGQRLAEIAAREEEVDKRKTARWYLNSRLALAIVQIDASR